MAKKYSDKELQNKPVEELERIKEELQQSKGRTKPKLSDTQLQSMSVEELEKVKKDLIRKKP